MEGQPDFSAMWRALWGRIEAYIDRQFVERGFTGRFYPAANLRGTLPAHSHDEYATDLDLSGHAGDADAHHDQAHAIVGADHTAAGLTPGHVLTALSETTAGFQAPSGGASELDDLTDVDLGTPPTDGQALVWDETLGMWVPGSVAAGGSPPLTARARTAVAQSVAHGGYTRIDFDSVDYDAESAITTGASWHFTAPRAGRYHLSALITLAQDSGWAAGEWLHLAVFKGVACVALLGWVSPPTGNVFAAAGGSTTLDLAEGDTVYLATYQTSGGAISLYPDNTCNHVSIEEVVAGGGSGGADAAAIHGNASGEIAALTEKTTPVAADLLVIEDSADSNAKKKVQLVNLPSGGGETINVANAPTTWVNQGGASYNLTASGLYLRSGVAAARNSRLLVKAAPTVPYTITARLRPLLFGQLNGAGLCFREAATGKQHLFWFAFYTGNRLFSSYWSGAATAVTDYIALPAVIYGPMWLRIADDNTNRVCSVSVDGVNWHTYHSLARNTQFVADQVGIVVNGEHASQEAGLQLLQWIEG